MSERVKAEEYFSDVLRSVKSGLANSDLDFDMVNYKFGANNGKNIVRPQ